MLEKRWREQRLSREGVDASQLKRPPLHRSTPIASRQGAAAAMQKMTESFGGLIDSHGMVRRARAGQGVGAGRTLIDNAVRD